MTGESIDELIVANVVTTLEGISRSAGYFNDITVEREKTTGNSPRHGLIVVALGDPIPQDGAPLMHDEWLLPVGLACYVMESEAGIPIRTALNRMASDVHQALTADVQRGGYAINTEFLKDSPDQFEIDPPCHVFITAFVRYRTLYQRPYQQ